VGSLTRDSICADVHAEKNYETIRTAVLRRTACVHAVAGVMCTPADTRSVRPARILHGRLERTNDLFRADWPSVRRQHSHLCIPQQRRMVRLRLLPRCLHIRGRRWLRGFTVGCRICVRPLIPDFPFIFSGTPPRSLRPTAGGPLYVGSLSLVGSLNVDQDNRWVRHSTPGAPFFAVFQNVGFHGLVDFGR
jgi:hypothetical protein